MRTLRACFCACIVLRANKYTLRDNASEDCVHCVAGTYSTTESATTMDTCLHCPFSTQSPIGISTQTDCTCANGFTGPAGGLCRKCQAKLNTNATCCSQYDSILSCVWGDCTFNVQVYSHGALSSSRECVWASVELCLNNRKIKSLAPDMCSMMTLFLWNNHLDALPLGVFDFFYWLLLLETVV